MQFIVAVFPEKTKTSYRFSAYTRWFNPTWDGCNLVEIDAKTGKEAKIKAINIIKTRLSSDDKKSVKICRSLLA